MCDLKMKSGWQLNKFALLFNVKYFFIFYFKNTNFNYGSSQPTYTSPNLVTLFKQFNMD